MKQNRFELYSVQFPQNSKEIRPYKNSKQKKPNPFSHLSPESKKKNQYLRDMQTDKTIYQIHQNYLNPSQQNKPETPQNKIQHKSFLQSHNKPYSYQVDHISSLIRDRYEAYLTKAQQNIRPIFKSNLPARSMSFNEKEDPVSKLSYTSFNYYPKSQKPDEDSNPKNMIDHIRLSYSPVRKRRQKSKVNQFDEKLKAAFPLSQEGDLSRKIRQQAKAEFVQKEETQGKQSESAQKLNNTAFMNRSKKGLYSGSPYKHQNSLLQKLKRNQKGSKFSDYVDHYAQQKEKQMNQKNQKFIEYYKKKYGSVYLPKKTEKEVTQVHEIDPW